MAVILDGKSLKEEIVNNLSEKLSKMDENPCLAVILVGDNPASKVYVGHKQRTCEKIGIKSLTYELDADINEDDLLKLISDLNSDKSVNGILLQLPLPEHIDEDRALMAIDPSKDVDGFHPLNMGKLVIGNGDFISCTPKGIISLLEHYKIDIRGKSATVIGRSNIVGKPVSLLLTSRDATVTLAHSKTENLKEICKNSDILIVAIGREKFLTTDYVKDGAIVVDVGINRGTDGKLYGDVDFDEVVQKAGFITPVPGGVGPMTIASLMENVLIAYELQTEKGKYE